MDLPFPAPSRAGNPRREAFLHNATRQGAPNPRQPQAGSKSQQRTRSRMYFLFRHQAQARFEKNGSQARQVRPYEPAVPCDKAVASPPDKSSGLGRGKNDVSVRPSPSPSPATRPPTGTREGNKLVGRVSNPSRNSGFPTRITPSAKHLPSADPSTDEPAVALRRSAPQPGGKQPEALLPPAERSRSTKG